MRELNVLAAAALVGLAACSSEDILGRSAYDVDSDRLDELTTDIAARAPTSPRSLPTTGSVTYDGVLGFDTRIDGSARSVLGDLAMTTDFRTDRMVGTAGDFHADNDRRIGGSITLDNGIIDRTAAATRRDPTFSGSARGRLTTPAGTDLDYRGTFEGNFYGPSHRYMGGSLDGFVDDGITIDQADGSFAAER